MSKRITQVVAVFLIACLAGNSFTIVVTARPAVAAEVAVTAEIQQQALAPALAFSHRVRRFLSRSSANALRVAVFGILTVVSAGSSRAQDTSQTNSPLLVYKAQFLSQIETITKRFQNTYAPTNPYRMAVEAFDEKVQNGQFVFLQSTPGADAVGVAVYYRVIHDGRTGETRLVSELRVDWDIFNQVWMRAQKDIRYVALLDAKLIKEGATLRDIADKPGFYIDLLNMESESRKIDLILRDADHLDFMKALAVKEESSEEVGYRLALDYLDRAKRMTRGDLGRIAELERDPELKGNAYRYWLLMGKNEEEFRKNILLEEVLYENPALVKALVQAEGVTIKQDKVTGERTVKPSDFKFLSGKAYDDYLQKNVAAFNLPLAPARQITVVRKLSYIVLDFPDDPTNFLEELKTSNPAYREVSLTTITSDAAKNNAARAVQLISLFIDNNSDDPNVQRLKKVVDTETVLHVFASNTSVFVPMPGSHHILVGLPPEIYRFLPSITTSLIGHLGDIAFSREERFQAEQKVWKKFLEWYQNNRNSNPVTAVELTPEEGTQLLKTPSPLIMTFEKRLFGSRAWWKAGAWNQLAAWMASYVGGGWGLMLMLTMVAGFGYGHTKAPRAFRWFWAPLWAAVSIGGHVLINHQGLGLPWHALFMVIPASLQIGYDFWLTHSPKKPVLFLASA